MIIRHNLTAMNAQRQLNLTGKQNAKSTEKLSSGYKINRAADDAAGLAISEKMRRQIRGLNQGIANTQDGISLNQVADGALAEVHEMLHRITELSVKAANGTNSPQDRQAIQQEINEILAEIDRIGDTTVVLSGKAPDSFSIGYYSTIHDWSYYEGSYAQLGENMIGADLGFSLLWHDALNQKGKQTYSFQYGIAETQKDSNLNQVPLKSDLTQLTNHYSNKPVWIQSGCDAGDGIWLELGEMNCKAIGIEKLDVSTVDGACDALDRLEGALNYISGFRSRLGAQQNRLEHTIANESNVVENTASAESLIRDTDMADMMVLNSLENVLMQAGQSMLAQANTSLQGVLPLLQQ